MADLNSLVAEDAPIYMVFATWINDVGEILQRQLRQAKEKPAISTVR